MSSAVSSTFTDTALERHRVRSPLFATLFTFILTILQRHMARAYGRERYPGEWRFDLSEIPRYPWRNRVLDWLEAMWPGSPDDDGAGMGESEVEEEEGQEEEEIVVPSVEGEVAME
jgi:hypothetical protein